MSKSKPLSKKEKLQEIVANLEQTLENQKMTTKTRNALSKILKQRKTQLHNER